MSNNTVLILALNMYKDGMLTDEEISKVLKNFSKKFEKLLDKSNQKWYNINVIKVSGN